MVTTEQAGEQMPMPARPRTKEYTMEVLPEAHRRSSKQCEPPETCKKEAMENGGGEAFGPQSDNTSSSTACAPSSLCLPPFIDQEGSRFPSLTILPNESNYLGSLCT